MNRREHYMSVRFDPTVSVAESHWKAQASQAKAALQYIMGKEGIALIVALENYLMEGRKEQQAREAYLHTVEAHRRHIFQMWLVHKEKEEERRLLQIEREL